MLFKGCGVLREIQSTAEAESKCDSQETPGGFWQLQYAPFGGVFLGLCRSGLVFGATYCQRLSIGNYVVEPLDELRVKITDNVFMVSDVYTAPEPLTGLYLGQSERPSFIATTQTSIIVWLPPAPAEALQLKNQNISATMRTQWIQEPLRTQSYSEIMCKQPPQERQQEQSTIQTQVVGGVQFGVFNFDRSEDQAIKAAIQAQDRSPICKSALYLRHSVCSAWASDKYLVLQDISGECHVCQLATLALMYTLYNGSCHADQLCVTDEVMCFVDGPTLRLTDTQTG